MGVPVAQARVYGQPPLTDRDVWEVGTAPFLVTHHASTGWRSGERVRPVNTRPACRWVWLQGVRCLRHRGTNRITHRMMVLEGRRLRCCHRGQVSLGLRGVGSPSHGSIPYTRPSLIAWVVEQMSNVVNKEGVQMVRYLLLVGKL
jgi:hypothetical protein